MTNGVGSMKNEIVGKILQYKFCSHLATKIILFVSRYDELSYAKQQFENNMKDRIRMDELNEFAFHKFGQSEGDLSTCLTKIMFEYISNLTMGIECPTTMKGYRVQNIQEWHTRVAPSPIHVDTIKLLSLDSIYIIDAIHEVMNSIEYENKEVKQETKEKIAKLLRNNVGIALKKGKKTAEGKYAKDECQKALNSMKYLEDSQYSHLLDCGSMIPKGTHVAYEFGGNKLHHAIYLGSNVLAEMRNFSTKHGVVSSIHVTYLYDFLRRVRNSPSPLYAFVYQNSYDPDIIVNRAVWSLGIFQYNIFSSNCESFVRWVMTNAFESPLSYLPYVGKVSTSKSKIQVFPSRNTV